jgi:hypothetical protein
VLTPGLLSAPTVSVLSCRRSPTDRALR